MGIDMCVYTYTTCVSVCVCVCVCVLFAETIHQTFHAAKVRSSSLVDFFYACPPHFIDKKIKI